MFYCYIITNGKNTYNGYTNDLKKRLRQHNGELVGGAKATRGRGPWRYVCILSCESWSSSDAMSVEWHIKYPTNKRPRPRIYEGPYGRLASLPFALMNCKDPSAAYVLFVAEEFAEGIPAFNPNVVIMDMNNL